ncbi:MAG: acyl-CoA dehydrogenase [Bdellovibrionaceae bacterium]|nr:acyl-CoA dehydrogenase [Pseudobdellovibrionaceae bacterium]
MKDLLFQLIQNKKIRLIFFSLLFLIYVYFLGKLYTENGFNSFIAFIPLSLKTTVALTTLILLFFHSSFIIWTAFLLLILSISLSGLPLYFMFFGIIAGLFLLFFAFSFLFFKGAKKLNMLPKISETEKIALHVGEPWIEKEFFKGLPDFKNLFNQAPPRLSEREQIFLNDQVEDLCSLSTEWDFLKRKKLLPSEEEIIKKEKFFGLSVPKSYKGLEFSPFAHAKVIEKIAGHNNPLAIITMVPNSLGPAKLLLKYGTKEQKDQYLKSLASADLWPCFGLTEVQAGSDASSIQSSAILFKQDGELKIKINFEKRWITLSSKADLIGLAVQLKDPDKLLSKKTNLGITCLLISSDLKGIERGFHHDPMGLPIYNAPIKGKNVIVPAKTAIIGGLKQAGQGWKMLMESLSAGRSISLPALCTASSKKVSWLTVTHAFVRRQFGVPIGKFEGIQEKLAKITGLTHLISLTHNFTLSGLNQGVVSPVISALNKYHCSELAQKVVKHGMDIMAGAGLSLGPRNKIANLHASMPVAITVEGANVLSRTLISYGQGLIKTHPQGYPIIDSLEKNNLNSFNKNLWIFLYESLCHFVRSILFTLTRAYTAWPVFLKRGRYLQKLKWSISLFAFLSNLNLMLLGGKLKTKGQITGRFADWLSFQYMICAVIWSERHEKNNKLAYDWSLEYCFSQIQKTVLDILNNYPITVARWLLKPLTWILKINCLGEKPSDKLNKQLANKILEDKKFKEDLCKNMYFPKGEEDQFQKLNKAYDLSLKEQTILNKIFNSDKLHSLYFIENLRSTKKDKLPKDLGKAPKKQISFKKIKDNFELFEKALKSSIISQEDFEVLKSAKKARNEAVQVDSFSTEEYFK